MSRRFSVAFAAPLRHMAIRIGCCFDDSGLEIIGLETSIRVNTESIGECRIGAVAPMSDTLRMSGDSGMTPSPRNRISVDLQGLKATLYERAKCAGILPSVLVREALADALNQPAAPGVLRTPYARHDQSVDRARLSLRMTRTQAAVVIEAARRAGMSPGDYVANLVAGVPVLMAGARRAEHVAALIASCAEMSSLNRNIHHLTSLLREGSSRAAQEYRVMLNTLSNDVQEHLRLASAVLAELRPRGAPGATAKKSNR
jgi:hypothetical protein